MAFEIEPLISFANEVIDNLEQVSAVLRTLHRFSNYQVESFHNYTTLIEIMSRMSYTSRPHCVRFARMGPTSLRPAQHTGVNNLIPTKKEK